MIKKVIFNRILEKLSWILLKNVFYSKFIRTVWNGFELVSILPISYNNSHYTRCVSSSSSCRAGSMDIPDPLSPLFPYFAYIYINVRIEINAD